VKWNGPSLAGSASSSGVIFRFGKSTRWSDFPRWSGVRVPGMGEAGGARRPPVGPRAQQHRHGRNDGTRARAGQRLLDSAMPGVWTSWGCVGKWFFRGGCFSPFSRRAGRTKRSSSLAGPLLNVRYWSLADRPLLGPFSCRQCPTLGGKWTFALPPELSMKRLHGKENSSAA
jgi:hypothetical protein